MTKIVALLTTRAGIGPDEFRSYWRGTHGPLVVMIPGLRKYIQSHVVADPAQPPPAV